MKLSSSFLKLLDLQKKFFQDLEKEVHHLLGPLPKSIHIYSHESQADFQKNKKIKSVSKETFLKAVQTADVLWIGDFHSLECSQQTALQVIQEVVKIPAKWSIGLEFIPSQFQTVLDEFQAGKISVQKFHEKISYQKEWGFPWKQYAPLFDWAKEHQVPLIALNRPKILFPVPDSEDLHERDQWAAGLITDRFVESTGQQKMVVLYGGLHVRSCHLPRQLTRRSKAFLKKPLRWVILHQNEDSLFWKLSEGGNIPQVDLIELKKNIFCTFSSTPWRKLESVVHWAENLLDHASETELDHLSMIQTYGKVLADFLQVKPISYERLTVCSGPKSPLLNTLLQHPECSPHGAKWIQFCVMWDQPFYLSGFADLCFAYLGNSHSSSTLSEFSGLHLLTHLGRKLQGNPKKSPSASFLMGSQQGFYPALLAAAFGSFSSRLLHPYMKCDFMKDLPKEGVIGSARETFPGEVQSRQWALQLLHSTEDWPFPVRKQQDLSILWMTAQSAGKTLGESLYKAVLSDTFSLVELHDTFLTRKIFSPIQAKRLFYQILEKLEIQT